MFDRLATSYARISDCLTAAHRHGAQWLAESERAEAARIAHSARREQWLAGRWLAKRLVLREVPKAQLVDVQILARDERGRGVRPQIVLAGRPLERTLSISHSDLGVLVALATRQDWSVGIDLADLRSGDAADRAARDSESSAAAHPSVAGFRRLWFTPSEQAWLTADPERRTATLWALKEAVYKACNRGESWEPRQVEIEPLAGWRFAARYRGLPLVGLTLAASDLDGHVAAVAQLPLSTPKQHCSPAAIATPNRTIRFDLPAKNQPTVLFRKPT